jgi:hypothetical protein
MLLYTISKAHNFMKNQNVSFPHSGSLEHEPHEGKDPEAKNYMLQTDRENPAIRVGKL